MIRMCYVKNLSAGASAQERTTDWGDKGALFITRFRPFISRRIENARLPDNSAIWLYDISYSVDGHLKCLKSAVHFDEHDDD
jgi:hypothetical protein